MHKPFDQKFHAGWIHVAGLLSALLYLWLAILSREYASLYALLAISASCFLLGVSVWIFYWKLDRQPPIWALLLWALAFRAIAVFVGEPILEDDHFRYLWDGFQLIENGNPYGIPPDAFFDHEQLGDQLEAILSNINNPHIATIYGPVCQYIFGLAYWIAPGQVWPLQLFSASLDMGIILLLLKMAAPRHVLLYAWSPLIIKEFAFTAHTDVLAVFFMLFAWYLASQLNKTRLKRMTITILMALAVASKVFAILLVPFLLRLRYRHWLIFAGTLLLLYLPFLLQGSFLGGQGFSAMANVWLFNAPVYFLYLEFFGRDGIGALKFALLMGFAVIYLYWLWRDLRIDFSSHRLFKMASVIMKKNAHHDSQNLQEAFSTPHSQVRPDWLYGLFLLVIPALNPWYLIWLLPFAVLTPSLWAWTASISLLLSYAIGLHLTNTSLEAYGQPGWVIMTEYSLILLAFAVDRWRHTTFKPDQSQR